MNIMTLPPLDYELSPYTGWTRDHWVAVADTILAGAAAHANESFSLISYPGAPGGYGYDVDGLEGFARTFMLAAFRIAGDPGGTAELAANYRRGIEAGVDPNHPQRWLRLDEVDQAKVEAAALALGLHLTRPYIWDRFSERTQQQVVDYMSVFIGSSYPPNNWAWFRIMVEQFIASVGGPVSPTDRIADFALLDSFAREGGWTSDGAGRNFDHYCGWALPFYPMIWSGMVEDDASTADRRTAYAETLDAFLSDALFLIGGDGSPLIQGRSLTYRFASAGSAWAAVLGGASRHSLGTLRHAASAQIAHFVAHGAPDADGLLTLGWHGEWRAIAQRYSGTGSPYWASKGMLGLMFPAEHPVWLAREEPLPLDAGDTLRTISAPGWIVSGTASDGVVRVINHGTDHRPEGALEPDAPLYAKFGYSTATSPVLTGRGVSEPIDGTVAVLRGGRPSHRSGFARGVLLDLDGAAYASSTATAHWPLELLHTPDHGDGSYARRTHIGGTLDVVSVVRGAWEVRFVRAIDLADTDGVIRVGGWALSGDALEELDDASVSNGRLVSRLVSLTGAASTGIHQDVDATPLGAATATPWAERSVKEGEWTTWAIALGDHAATATAPHVTHGVTLTVSWPDGHITPLPDSLNHT